MADRIRLATVVRPGRRMREALDRAAALEAVGLDAVGVPEAYGTDAVSLLGYLAARTERVELFAQILPLYSRTPTLTAMTAAGLDDVSRGRFNLGLGASGPQVIEGWHGVRYDAPLRRTREVIDICRTVWHRERLERAGPTYCIPLPAGEGTGLGKPLKLLHHPVRDRIPIWLAALGEQNVALAAELAEGWLAFLFVPERADQVWGPALARGLARRKPGLGDFGISAGGPFALTSDAQTAARLRDRDRDRLALYLGGMGPRDTNFYTQVAARYGFAGEAELVQRLYLDGRKDAAAAAVPVALLEGMSLIGDRAYLRDRLQAYAAAGVTVVQADPVGADPAGEFAVLRELAEDTTVTMRRP